MEEEHYSFTCQECGCEIVVDDHRIDEIECPGCGTFYSV